MAMVRWIPALVWMGVIFSMSAKTGSEIGSMFPFVDLLPEWMGGLDFGHLIAYYVLGLLVWFAIGDSVSSPASAKWLAIAISALYGATDEFHQLFVDGRSAEWRDLLNDTIGACLAMVTVSLPPVRRWLDRRRGKG